MKVDGKIGCVRLCYQAPCQACSGARLYPIYLRGSRCFDHGSSMIRYVLRKEDSGSLTGDDWELRQEGSQGGGFKAVTKAQLYL